MYSNTSDIINILGLKPKKLPKEKKNNKIRIFFSDMSKNINIAYESTSQDIISTINKKYPGVLGNLENYSMVFVHHLHGEKILDEFECPI